MKGLADNRWIVFLTGLWICLCVVFTLSGAAVAAEPARLVSLGPVLTENIFLLSAGDHLVGDTVYCTLPPEAKNREKIGSVQELSIEKIVALKPDIILATNLNPPQQLDKLRNLGLRVELFRQPANFGEICDQFLRLGTLLGRRAQAETILSTVRVKVDTVRKAVQSLPKRKVFLQVGANPLFASIATSFTSDFINLAGGTNIAGDLRSGMMKTEQIIALNPELIVIAVMGSENGIGAQEQKHWQGFPTIAAVREHQVYVMDRSLSGLQPLTGYLCRHAHHLRAPDPSGSRAVPAHSAHASPQILIRIAPLTCLQDGNKPPVLTKTSAPFAR